MPPTAGPMARAALNWVELRMTALRRSSLGTSSLTNACHDAMPIEAIVPLIATVAVIVHGDVHPATHSTHNASAVKPSNVWLTRSTDRRGKRSATEPASGASTTPGANWANVANPTHAALPVRRYTTKGTATFWSHVPLFDTSEDHQNSAKSRWRSAAVARRVLGGMIPSSQGSRRIGHWESADRAPLGSPSVPPSERKTQVKTTTRALVPVPKTSDPEVLADPRESDVDEWGRSEHMREIARRIFDPMYRRWFRVEWEGLEKIPSDGGALLVSNHAGAIPSDAPVIMHGIETELGRPVYGLAEYIFRDLPVVGTMWSRVGGVTAQPDNAYRLLREQKQLVLVFPEGTKGTSKNYRERYHLRRFGRGGFVEIAMRAGVPIVPIAVMGAEESMPIMFKLPGLAKSLGVPYVPITANMVAFGPLLGSVLYFPAKFKLKVLDPISFDVAPNQPRYSRSKVMDESEAIREKIQEALYEMLRERRSVWFG